MTAPIPQDHDLVVVGASIRAAELGMTVVIIEERYWDAVCVNTGGACSVKTPAVQRRDRLHSDSPGRRVIGAGPRPRQHR